MSEADEGQIAIDRKRFVDLIEVELWSKFQKRLWVLISSFLLFVTIPGLFGIPYFIRSETQKIFTSQSKRYEAEIRKITSFTKAYMFLFTQYSNYHQRLRQDIYTVIQDLKLFVISQDNKEDYRFGGPMDTFQRILHEEDPRDVLNFRNIISFWGLDKYEELRISIDEKIHLENTILGTTGSTAAPHPFRDGSLEGFIEDMKIRLLILAAYRNALQSLSENIFRIGGDFDELTAKTRALEVESVIQTVFLPSFDGFLKTSFTRLHFKGDERADFKEIFRLYIEDLNFDAAKIQSIKGFDVKTIKSKMVKLPDETESSKSAAGTSSETAD